MRFLNKNLGEIAFILNGYAFKSNEYTTEGIRIIRITNVQKGKIQDSNPQYVSLSRQEEFSNYLLREGDLLISLTGNVGRVGLLTKEFLPAALNQRVGCVRVADIKTLDINYLYQYLNTDYFESLCINNSNGIAQLNLSTKWLEQVQIPLPPLPEQIAIANLLSKAEALITKRKESLALLDAYLKSTFLELFGDPVRNEKGWEVKRLGDVIVDLIAGASYGGEMTGSLADDELGVIKVSAVTWGYFNPREFKAIKKSRITKTVIHPLKNDLLFSRANTKELVGATCIVDKDYRQLFLPDKIWKIILDSNKMQNVYFHHLMLVPRFKDTLTRDATGTSGSMLNISMEKLRGLYCPVPPLEFQKQFAAVVEKVEALKEKYLMSLGELENLYGSLSQRAFRGELGVGG
ncbi:restriction endonuclease subunit S [Leptospira vanthielii]|uniref:restriction endonuclease subunit S n=1 Tax=Leptospira vanthielii TaxID=293085 RepID=UPI00143D8C1F|nr:restriction endonuclease subunit S [Leptospira vanthielii]